MKPPYPKWYNPNAKYAYHDDSPGHSTKNCMALRIKVQQLRNASWLFFGNEPPNVNANPLPNHGNGAVNIIIETSSQGQLSWVSEIGIGTGPRLGNANTLPRTSCSPPHCV